MSKLRFKISMSLDGYVAGPDQSVNNPIGIGGMRLHEWVFPLAAWRRLQGLEGGEVNESCAVVEESLANIGATVMGRNMFGGHPGPWNSENGLQWRIMTSLGAVSYSLYDSGLDPLVKSLSGIAGLGLGLLLIPDNRGPEGARIRDRLPP